VRKVGRRGRGMKGGDRLVKNKKSGRMVNGCILGGEFTL